MCSGRFKTTFREKNYITVRMGAESFFETSVHILQYIFVVMKKTGTPIFFCCTLLHIHKCLQIRHMRNILNYRYEFLNPEDMCK
jgi:hypothetical protein